MSWTEIVIEIARDHAEALSEALMDVGALSVSVEDADEGTDAEKPLFGEPGMEPTEAAWDHSRVVALTDEDDDQSVIVAAAAGQIGLTTLPKFTTRKVEEQDWVRLTQSQFAPIQIGKNIWVVPSWHEAPNPDALILELDPGLAFGTGSHPTTRLCMEWLEANPAPGKTVLDYGCGSGILAMVAKKVGAGEVVGVDIDPQAIESAADNATRNNCEIEYFLPDVGHHDVEACVAAFRYRGGQHPVQPAEADGADAVGPRGRWRCADPVGRAGAPGRGSGGGVRAVHQAGRLGRARRLGGAAWPPR